MKSIPKYNNYSVTECGKVANTKFNRILKPRNHKGYSRVVLYRNGKPKDMFVHRLVAMAFIPNPENKLEINHIDGNKQNNNVSNLEWATRKENAIHSVKTGLQIPKGQKRESHPKAKIVLDTQTGVFYYCLKNLCELYCLNYNTIKAQLSGLYKNKTQFIYT